MLSLILPTFNEAANISSLLELLDGVLAHLPHEIIIVDDDSPDGTWKVVGEFARSHSSVKVLRRLQKKGLSSAVVDGFDAAHGSILAVMDADGQHDSTLLLSLVRAIEQGADLGIGSRYVEGGSVGSWVADRRIISRAGTFFAKRLSSVPVSDPLGGFFVLQTDLYRKIRSKLHPTGFKILLEILAAVPATTKLVEVPLVFRMRLHGESKLSFRVHLAFVLQILRLSFRRCVARLFRLGGILFALCMLLAAMMLVPRAIALKLLYTDGRIRASVQSALEAVADKEGWILSDVTLESVTEDSISILHHPHLRQSTKTEHCTVNLHTQLLTCAD